VKKVVVLILVVMLILATTGSVFAREPVNTSKICTENNDLGMSHGECVSMFASAPAKICQLDTLGFKNHGQCVKFLNSLMP